MKKILLFLMFALFCIPWAANAQSELTIYEDGTATSSNVPIHGTWADAYLKCEFVVPADQLVEMSGGTISQMDFYLTTPATEAWTGTFQVFLREVDDATISSYYGPGDATVVYEGTLDGTQSTLTVAFSDNYIYGGGNLLVGVYQIVKGNWKSATFAGETVTGASGQGYNSSSLDGVSFSQKNFIPKTTFTYTPGGGSVCEKPFFFTTNNVTSTSCEVMWESSDADNIINLQYKAASESEWTEVNGLTGMTYTITDLLPGTVYNARVQVVCGEENLSGWKTLNFTTECGVITTFPWIETFESYAAGNLADPCWVNEHIEGSGTYLFKVYTSSNEGNTTHQLQLPDMAGGTLTKLVLPEMNVPANYEFSIDIYRSNSTYNNNNIYEGVRVYASTDGEIEGATELAFIPRQYNTSNDVIPAETATGWYTYELPIGFSGTCYIILRGESQYCTSTYMDNLAVKAMPTCIRPTSLAVTANSVTAHNATITWTENGDATNWIVEYDTVSTFATFMTETVQGQPTYTFTGLDPETTFYVRVKADCGAEDGESEYSNEVHFTTTIACPAPTGLAVNPANYSAAVNWNGTSESYNVSYRTAAYAEGIVEEFNTSGVPSGWTRYSGLVDDVIAGEANLTTTNSGWSSTSYALGQYNIKLNIYGTGSKYWLVTPEFNLSQNLSFDLALTDYNNADPIENPEAQADDRFVVLIYANETWRILREWNNSGSEYVYNAISSTGENVSIDLSAYYGQNVKIAFYGESTSSTDENAGDNDLHIDNVVCGIPYEAGEWQTITTTETTAIITDLNPETAYEVKVQGDCGELDGVSLETAIVSFTTLEGCPVPQNVDVEDVTSNSATVTWEGYDDSYNVNYRSAAHADGIIEHFDAGIPSGWTRYTGLVDEVLDGTTTLTTATGGWVTNSYALGQYNMKLNIYGENYVKYWLVTPEFNLSQNLSFDLALTDYNNSDPIENPEAQADDRFVVLIYANNAWHILREWNNSGSEYVYNTISTTGENVTIDLSAYYGKKVKIAFYGESTSSTDENAGDNDLHIDNIVCGTPIEAGEWQTVEATESPVVLTDLTPETPYEVKIQGVCDDVETEWTEVVTFTTEAEQVCTIGVPYEETFETYTTDMHLYTFVLPDCWTVAHQYYGASMNNIGLGVDTLPQLYRAFNHTEGGNYSLRIKYRSILAMPALDESVDLSRLRLQMYVRQPHTYYNLEVGMMSDLNDESTFEPIALVRNMGHSMTYFECGFNNYQGEGRYIAFRNVGGSENDPYCSNYLDDITLTYADAEEPCEINIPYVEDFEGYEAEVQVGGGTGVEPRCWEIVAEEANIDSYTKPQLYGGFNMEDGELSDAGSYSLRLKNRCVYAMPALSADFDIHELTMSFSLRQTKFPYRLQVGVVNNDGEFELVKTINLPTDNPVQEVLVDFAEYEGNGNRIAFRNTTNSHTTIEYSTNYIDDIYVDLTSEFEGKNVAGEGNVNMDAYLESIAVYPNPTTGNLYIDAMGIQKVECYNQMGQLVRVYDNVLNSIDLNNLSEGVYMLRITVPQGVTMRKVVKK